MRIVGVILFAIDCKGEIYMGNQVKGHLFVSYIYTEEQPWDRL
jgi:hypothetical protein